MCFTMLRGVLNMYFNHMFAFFVPEAPGKTTM